MQDLAGPTDTQPEKSSHPSPDPAAPPQTAEIRTLQSLGVDSRDRVERRLGPERLQRVRINQVGIQGQPEQQERDDVDVPGICC